MKIQCQPDKQCRVCETSMALMGSTGTQDVYKCETCNKIDFHRWQERRGSARKKASDEPIEVFACSGEFQCR